MYYSSGVLGISCNNTYMYTGVGVKAIAITQLIARRSTSEVTTKQGVGSELMYYGSGVYSILGISCNNMYTGVGVKATPQHS